MMSRMLNGLNLVSGLCSEVVVLQCVLRLLSYRKRELNFIGCLLCVGPLDLFPSVNPYNPRRLCYYYLTDEETEGQRSHTARK